MTAESIGRAFIAGNKDILSQTRYELNFAKGTLVRKARSKLAKKIKKGKGAKAPFAVATARIKKWYKTQKGRRTIWKLAGGKPPASPSPRGRDGGGKHMAKKGKKMSADMKAFLKKHGRFPRKGELGRKGGGGGGGGGRKSNPGRSSAEGIGKQYLRVMRGQATFAPALDSILDGGAPLAITKEIGRKALTLDYGENLVVGGAQAYLDAKLGQAGALSRGSVTAIAPEVLLGAAAVEEARAGGDARTKLSNINWRLSKIQRGYDPDTGKFAPDREFWVYNGVKYGLAAARKARARMPLLQKLTSPLDGVRKALGLSW